MSADTFTALVLEQRDGATHSEIRQLPASALPAGDVLVRVAYSDLNYKDGLAITGRGRVVRSFPIVPGIDLAGTVVESAAPAYQPGDEVVLTGWGIGEVHWGGHAQLARVQAGWLVPLPAGMTLQQAMGVGTAGFTAMLSVMALEEQGLRPGERQVLVTGASGGVGSVAVAILAQLGYQVVASTGKDDEREYLKALGAHEVIGRLAPAGKPLESERWGGAVDTVGGATLAALLPAMANRTSVAACGNAGGLELHTSVFPFILRGVNLLGINSVYTPRALRLRVWERIASDLRPRSLGEIATRTIELADLPSAFQQYIDASVVGRTVVRIA